jgi:hypothetical protein
MKYTLIAEDEYGGSTTTREFTEDYLPHVLTEIELFLKGAGFVFNGNLDFVDDTETVTCDDYELETDLDLNESFDNRMWKQSVDNVKHSEAFFDTERNK